MVASILLADNPAPSSPVPPVTPNTNFPGNGVLTSLVGSIATLGLIACVVGFIVGCSFWWVGSHMGGGNPMYVSRGRLGAFASILGAIGIGAAAVIVNWAFNLGRTVQ